MVLVSAVSCKGDPTTVPKGTQAAVVYAVLNPVANEQYILLENTLSGRVNIPRVENPDPREPIKDRGGDPIIDAYVVIYNEHGDSAVALERRTDPGSLYHQGGGGKGAGVYAFFAVLPRWRPPEPPPPPYFMQVVRGTRYRLYVRAADGRQLTAATTVPDVPATTLVTRRTFNRDHDTVSLELPPARFAKRYGIHVQTPRGPLELFTEELQYRLVGSLRNVDAERRPRAFMPGFEQVVSLSAVDTNYFDFFRSSNDTISGLGLIEHIDGGIGVFGSYAPLNRVVLVVTADMDQPVEARYVEEGTGKSLQLYVNEQAEGLQELTGSYTTVGGASSGVLGQLRGGDMSLVFLAGQTVADTLYTVAARWTGDAIMGQKNDGTSVIFRKALTP